MIAASDAARVCVCVYVVFPKSYCLCSWRLDIVDVSGELTAEVCVVWFLAVVVIDLIRPLCVDRHLSTAASFPPCAAQAPIPSVWKL